MVEINLHPKLQILFKPSRYKVLYGGRAGMKSWGIAIGLLILGTKKSLRILCARELQNSIAESCHKLLSDQIDALGLTAFYEVQANKIIGRNGTTFSFEGIKNNATKIKSYEGIDICWVEEAGKVSKGSWEILVPTIRKPGSEIWMSFNPELETDYTWVEFVKTPRPGSLVQKLTFKDNPWLSQEIKDEIEDCKAKDPDAYLNIWEGFPRRILDGVIYSREMRNAEEEGRICAVPYERMVPVDTIWDLGRSDLTAIWFCQTVGMQYRVLRYYEARGHTVDHYIQYIQKTGYAFGTHWLPHDAKAKLLGTKKSIQEQVEDAFDQVRLVPKLGVEDGINAARSLMPNCWWDEKLCEDGLNRLRQYKFKVIEGQFSNKPLHDDNSNGADAWRYYSVVANTPGGRHGKQNVAEKLKSALARSREKMSGGSHGWMGH